MTRDKKRSGGLTAGELAAQLAQDPEYQKMRAAQEAALQAKATVWRTAERPIRDDLRAAGVEVESVWDLVNTSEPYPNALPILMDHLERGGYPDRVTEGVARALAVQPAHVYWPRLRDLYLKATGRDATEGLAVALSATARPENLDDLLMVVRDESRGSTRIHLISTILEVGGKRGRLAVESLRTDPVVGKEATALIRGDQ